MTARRQAYWLTAYAIADWMADYAMGAGDRIDPMVAVELERIRDAMLAAAEVEDGPGVDQSQPSEAA